MALHQEFEPRMKPAAGDARHLTILLIVKSAVEKGALPSSLEMAGNVDVTMVERQQWPLDVKFLGDTPPDAILVDVDQQTAEDLDFIRRLKLQPANHRRPIVALVHRNGEYASLHAIQAGADDVLFQPIVPQDVRSVVLRAIGAPYLHGEGPDANSRVIVFMHVTGGAGATTLAVNVGCALSQANPHHETCLLDLDLQFGTAANFLDLSHVSPVEEFIEDPGRMDRVMLEGMMAHHASGLDVLTAPRLPVPLHALRPSDVGELIDIAKTRYENVVVDLPVALAPWTNAVLDRAMMIYVVTPLTVPSAHQIARLTNLLRNEGMANLPVRIVANRHGMPVKGGADIEPARFASAIGHPVDHIVPDDYALISLSQNQGTPAIRLKPKSRFSVAVQDLVNRDLAYSDGLARTRRLGFFGL